MSNSCQLKVTDLLWDCWTYWLVLCDSEMKEKTKKKSCRATNTSIQENSTTTEGKREKGSCGLKRYELGVGQRSRSTIGPETKRILAPTWGEMRRLY